MDGESGKVISRFLPELQRDLGLVYQPEHWDEVRLAAWLCRNLPEPSLTHASKQAFVAKWLTELLRRQNFPLARANLQKFLLRNLLEARIRDLRRQTVGQAFQQALFGDDAASRVAVTDQYAFEFQAQAYAPSRDYDGRFGSFDFRKHFYDASAISTARRSSNAPAGWTFRPSKVVSSSGFAILSGEKAVRSSCRRPMAGSTPTFCVSYRASRTSMARYSPSRTRARTVGLPPPMTA